MQGDSLKPLPPLGYVYLTREGFRNVLRQRIDLATCNELIKNRDSTVFLQSMQISTQKMQIDSYVSIDKEHQETRRKLRNRLFWKNAELWGMRGLAVYLTYKLVTK